MALQFNADMAQSFDTLVKMQADPKANGLVLTVPAEDHHLATAER